MPVSSTVAVVAFIAVLSTMLLLTDVLVGASVAIVLVPPASGGSHVRLMKREEMLNVRAVHVRVCVEKRTRLTDAPTSYN